jgi:hypothetical protein
MVIAPAPLLAVCRQNSPQTAGNFSVDARAWGMTARGAWRKDFRPSETATADSVSDDSTGLRRPNRNSNPNIWLE